MVQVKVNTVRIARNERRDMLLSNNRRTYYNQPTNFFEAQTFAPRAFMSQTFTPQTFTPQTFALQTSVPQAFEPHRASLQTFAPQTFAPQAFTVRAIVPQAIASRTLAPRAIASQTVESQTMAPRTIASETFAPQTLARQTPSPRSSAPQRSAPPTSTSLLMTTLQRSQAIQQNHLQSNASHETFNKNINDRLKSSSSCPAPNPPRSLKSIWTYSPQLLPSSLSFLPVTILTPWYGADWVTSDSCYADEICARSLARARERCSHVEANSTEESSAAADQTLSDSLRLLWDVPITELYKTNATQIPQHQSKMSKTFLEEQQEELLLRNSSNLGVRELIPSIQIGQTVIYACPLVELQHELNKQQELQNNNMQISSQCARSGTSRDGHDLSNSQVLPKTHSTNPFIH